MGERRRGRIGKGVSHVGDAFVTRLQKGKQKRMTGGRKGTEPSDVAEMLALVCLGCQAATANHVCLSVTDCLSFLRCVCVCGFQSLTRQIFRMHRCVFLEFSQR